MIEQPYLYTFKIINTHHLKTASHYENDFNPNIYILSCIFLTSCKASADKEDIDNYVKVDLKNYATDNYRLLIEANKNVNTEPALKNSLFNNTYVKLETARSLLNEEYNDWIEGLEKNGYDYGELNSLCWMVILP